MLRAAAIVFVGVLPAFVAAQKATCQPGFEWMFSSTGESPCDIAADLAGVCIGTQFTLAPLDSGFVYLGPSVANANSCRCSSVYYSLLSACAACQNRNFIRWSAYNPNCTTVFSQVFSNPIPAGTKVPHYAYLDIETGDNFNISAAQSAGGIESTRPATPSGTGTSVGSSPTNTAAPHKKSNAGAIAGGVVGGVALLALIALGIFFFLRRRKAKAADASSNNHTQPSMGYANTGNTVPSNYTGATGTPGKVYDPNDPTTFPATHNTGAAYNPYPSPGMPQHPSPFAASQNQNLTHNYTGATQAQSVHTSGRPNYSGAPEL